MGYVEIQRWVDTYSNRGRHPSMKKFEQIKEKTKKQFQTFSSLEIEELKDILGLTIKKDEVNKLITFLCLLSAYTESSQFNISFNAPSSTGKSYIPVEIAKLFPKEDLIKLAYASPMSFYHSQGVFDKEKKGIVVDLSRKILIFLDMPHNQLLERLRSLLSHDEKELKSQITDKNQKYGQRTKNVFIKGFPAVIFCSAGLKLDEQEGTRFLLLSPETNQDKIKAAVMARAKKEADSTAYDAWLNNDERRITLKERIEAIKAQQINDIKIPDVKSSVIDRFLKQRKYLKPRHSRDIGRIISFVKTFTLFNLWDRERDKNDIIAKQEDIDNAFDIWDSISESQEFNLPPYVFQLFEECIKPAYEEKNKELISGGLTRREIIDKHFEIYGSYLPDWKLRREILPMLDTAGIIFQEPDQEDKRKMLIYPTVLSPVSSDNSEEQEGKNRENYRGDE